MDWNEIEGNEAYVVTHYSGNHDITAPFEVVVTAPATGAWWLNSEVFASATETMVVEEDVTIGVAGTAMTFRRLVRDGDYPDDGGPLVEQGGTYTGGTTIFTSVSGERNDRRFKLKQSTSYQITVTTLADDNVAALQLTTWKGP